MMNSLNRTQTTAANLFQFKPSSLSNGSLGLGLNALPLETLKFDFSLLSCRLNI